MLFSKFCVTIVAMYWFVLVQTCRQVLICSKSHTSSNLYHCANSVKFVPLQKFAGTLWNVRCTTSAHFLKNIVCSIYRLDDLYDFICLICVCYLTLVKMIFLRYIQYIWSIHQNWCLFDNFSVIFYCYLQISHKNRVTLRFLDVFLVCFDGFVLASKVWERLFYIKHR